MPERYVVAANVVGFDKRGTGLGKHYVYTVRVTWSDDSKLVLYRTYVEFFNLHVEVVKKFPLEADMIDEKDKVLPQLPRKIYVGRSNVRKVAEKRQEALDKYLEAFVKLEKKIVTCPPAQKFFQLRPTDLDPRSEDKASGRKSLFAFFKKEKDEQAERRTSTGQQISQPLQLEQYQAISNYKKNNRDQMDLVTDKEYEVITKDTSGWWLVKKGEMLGWVPASYLEPLHHNPEEDFLPKSEGGEQVIIVKDYKSTGEFKDELTFPKHAVMKVVYKTLDGWWYVRYNETNGYVPAAYLKTLKETQTFGSEKEQAPPVENTEDFKL